MSAAEFEANADRRAPSRATFPRGLVGVALPLAALAVAVAWQCVLSLDCDVSWLLTVGERFLDGRRIYADIQEINPPASFLLYVPALIVARLTGVSAEFATAASVFLLGVAAIVGAGSILVSASLPDGARRTLLALAAVFAFLLMPVACFAQREHIAVLTLLPLLAVLSAQSDGRRVGWRTALVAGLGAGVTIAIKPHFACAVVLPAAYLVWRRRSSSAALAVPTLAAGAVVAAYAACVALFFPAYLSDMMPLTLAMYLPVRDSLVAILLQAPSLLFLAFAGLGLWQARYGRASSLAQICMLAGTGFFLAMLVQGKGYLNHVYPAVALSAFATADILINTVDRNGARLRFAAGGLIAMALSALVTFGNVAGYAGLAEKVAAVAPPHPRIIAVASNLDVGHPLTRQVGGEWVGRRCSLWVTANAAVLRPAVANDRAALAGLRGYAEADARMFAEDVRAGRPDIVLVDEGSGKTWIAAHPAVAEALQGYRAVASVAGFALWRRPQHDAGDAQMAPTAQIARR